MSWIHTAGRTCGSLLVAAAFPLFARAAPPAPSLPEPLTLSAGWQLQDAAKVSAAGETISRAGFPSGAWYHATVPGTVLTSLVNDGVYPEPLYGENNRPDRIPESLCHTSYWYRTQFTPPRSYAGKHVWLTFHGINYTADVWVNGHSVGTIRGAFARGIFDITPYVHVGAPNGLAVDVHPQPHVGVVHEQTQATGVGPNGGDTARDGPTFLCAVGWDWIPGIRDRDTGIWQDVMLSATGPVVLQDPDVTSKLPLPRTDSADLTVQATLRNVTDRPQRGVLTGTADGGGIRFARSVTLAPGETQTVTLTPATAPALHVRHPHLWWPNGYGAPNLYTLHLRFTPAGGGGDGGAAAVSDRRDVTFGIRQIGYSLPGSDNLTLVVNGVPIMAKGGDWGMDEALKRIPLRRLDAQIRFHQLANYTIIRNWVGQSTSDAFYDLCDRYGILVWDEFFQPNPADGPNPDDANLYLANVREKVLRYRSHPCIALWCARNEGDPPPAIGAGIQKLLTALDPGRLYQPSSTAGRGVRSGGPYYWRPPREFYAYNEAFKTETGSVSVPTLEAVHAMMPAKDWETINDDWAEHDLCAGAQGGDRYPETLASRYGPIANLADFVRKAQLANYEAFRAMYEGRFAKLFQPSTGVITWMSNPAQPSFVWQIYSHDLEPNASLYGAQKACEPIHVQMNETDWHVMVINNTPRPLAGVTVRTAVYGLDGRLQYERHVPLTAAASAATDSGIVVPFPTGVSASASPVHFVRVELRDRANRLLSENFYWRGAPDRPDDLRSLNDLPTVALSVHATRRADAPSGRCLLDVTVHNPTRSVALMAHLQLRRARSGTRVLPVFTSDNYVSLLPGETRRLTVDAAVADLGGEAPQLAVDGWNVTVARSAASRTAVAVVPNTEAQVSRAALAAAAAAVNAAPAADSRIQINCGGSSGPYRFGAAPPPPPGFSRDRDFRGGDTASTGDTIDTSAPNAAPARVYQTERWGPCVYTIPVQPGHTYTVRLHFAEVRYDPGQRKFNVAINGRPVLTEFDIAAEAGRDKALIKEFKNIAPNERGHIVIAFRAGSADQPKVCGIEVLPE